MNNLYLYEKTDMPIDFYLECLYIFIIVLVVDICWTFYIKYVSEKRPILSGLFSALIIFGGGLVVRSYTENILFLIPSTFGAYLGAYLVVKFLKK